MRYEKTVDGQTINHVWDGGKQIVADVIDNQFYEADCYIRGTNLVAKYNYRNGNKSEYTYYTQNAHGDVVNLTDKDGKVTKKYTYDAFGVEKNIDKNDANAFRYCGEYFDSESGTIYLRARYYDPSIGRFISRDSYTGDNIDPLSLNLYTYCLNNPMHFVDENGHWPSLSKIIKAAATVAVAAVAVTAIVATAGAAGAAVGVAAGMYLGVSSATAVTISTVATVGAYAVAGGIGATALSDAGEELTGTNVIRDKLMGGNQGLYDTVRGGLYTVGAGYVALGSSNSGLSSGKSNSSDKISASSKKSSVPKVAIDDRKLQHEQKHSADFGVTGNWNKDFANRYRNAITEHIDNADEIYASKYRGDNVYTYINSETSVGAYTDLEGNYVGGWKFNQSQLDYHRNNGTRLN